MQPLSFAGMPMYAYLLASWPHVNIIEIFVQPEAQQDILINFGKCPPAWSQTKGKAKVIYRLRAGQIQRLPKKLRAYTYVRTKWLIHFLVIPSPRTNLELLEIN